MAPEITPTGCCFWLAGLPNDCPMIVDLVGAVLVLAIVVRIVTWTEHQSFLL
jgi:hypothetical protein